MQMPSYPRDVEEALVLGPGFCAEGHLSSQDANDRCFPHRLGFSPRWPLDSRSVERSPSFMALKLLENDSGISSTEILSLGSQRLPCPCPHRQHISSHKSPGGSAVTPSMQTGASDTPLGPG